MLWVDQIFISTSDLTRIDGQIQQVANAEGITLTGDNGAIKAGIEEAASELTKFMIAFGGYLNSGDLSANHLAAVLNVGIGNSVRQKALLDQVCVSGTSASNWNHIKNWAVFWVLRTFYRNAYARTVNDRYEKRMLFYKDELLRRITPNVTGMGIPIVLQPLYAPAAYFTRNPGSWDSTNLSLASGSGTISATIDVVVTYVSQGAQNLFVSSANPNNAESDAPPRASLAMTPGKVLQVSIASLNPPNGVQDPSSVLVTVIAPLAATGWNIYAGVSGGNLYLQTASPIPIATKSYTLPGDPILSGTSLSVGQYPNRRLSITPTRQRA